MADAAASAAMNPYAPPGGSPYLWAASGYREQHRGPVILALGLAGMFLCDIACIAAVVMAIIDLSKMAKGTMDPSGRALTIAGLVIAAIRLSFWIFVIGLLVVQNLM
jgi:hypothetical protein